MEKRLFSLYLKYIDDHYPSVWKRLNKLPWTIKGYMIGMIISCLITIILLFIYNNLNGVWSSIASVVFIVFLVSCVVLSILLFLSIEKHEIEVSNETMNEYWQYCWGVRTWFSKNFINATCMKNNIDDEILEVKNRIDMYISDQIRKNELRSARIDKLIQALAIPFVLAIITAILNKSTSTINAVSEIMAIFVIFITLVEIVWSIYSVVKVIKKQKLEQMKYFSENLQGALDCIKYAPDISLLDENRKNDCNEKQIVT